MFYKEVDTSSKVAMLAFLKDHPRYYTMNSWNKSQSYAHCVKLYKLDLPVGIRSKAYEMLESPHIWLELNEIIRDWDLENNYQYQAAFNGRSGGYIVMISGGQEGERVYSRPGKDIDFYDEEATVEELQASVALVQSFDKMCDAMRDKFIEMCTQYEIVTEEVMVPKKVKVLREVANVEETVEEAEKK